MAGCKKAAKDLTILENGVQNVVPISEKYFQMIKT